MKSINLVGRFTKDPEQKQAKNGDQFVRFSIAVNAGKDATEFYECSAFKKTAEVISKYCKKGNKVCISGTPTIQDWTDKDGNKRKSFSTIVNQIEFMSQNQYSEHTKSDEAKTTTPEFDDSEELPFA